MKIGIPRSFVYYYFKDFWISFFNFLNIDVILSPKTNKEIMDLGLKYSTDEMCLSLKNYIGHVAYLQDKCDYILVPRVANYGIKNQTCTNFLALYDIINNLFENKILNYNIDLNNNEDELFGLIKSLKELKIGKKDIVKAYRYAKEKSEEIKLKKISYNLRNLKGDKKKILIVGHPYNIYDEYIGKPIIDIIKTFDVNIIYSDLFDCFDKSKKYSKGVYWKYSKENISSIVKSESQIDGIIFISAFPCGLDSLVNELLFRKLRKPFINLIIDDIDSLAGFQTRIESFIDILNQKINKE